jgi:hypothetical protein
MLSSAGVFIGSWAKLLHSSCPKNVLACFTLLPSSPLSSLVLLIMMEMADAVLFVLELTTASSRQKGRTCRSKNDSAHLGSVWLPSDCLSLQPLWLQSLPVHKIHLLCELVVFLADAECIGKCPIPRSASARIRMRC